MHACKGEREREREVVVTSSMYVTNVLSFECVYIHYLLYHPKNGVVSQSVVHSLACLLSVCVNARDLLALSSWHTILLTTSGGIAPYKEEEGLALTYPVELCLRSLLLVAVVLYMCVYVVVVVVLKSKCTDWLSKQLLSVCALSLARALSRCM